jgi:hypothetical protein
MTTLDDLIAATIGRYPDHVLAARFDVASPGTLRRVRAGGRPRAYVLRRIARALGVDVRIVERAITRAAERSRGGAKR